MSGQPPLRVLEALGDELERATQADEQRATRRRRRRHLPGLPVLALIAAVSITGVAAAATQLFGLAAPVSPPAPGDVPREARPLPSTVTMAGLDAADPDGLPSWDVRVSRTRSGEICTAVGQTQDGTFGILGLDRKFRALPLGTSDACGLPPARNKIQVGARQAIGGGTMSPRTLVVGIAGPGVTQLRIDRDDKVIPIGKDRAFLAVLKGLPDIVQPQVQVISGAVQDYVSLASDDRNVTRDPEYGVPDWEYRSGPERAFVHIANGLPGKRDAVAADTRTCVQAHQPQDPTSAGTDADYVQAYTPITCWPKDRPAVVASVRRLVPSAGGSGPFNYGLAPARTIVQGLATADVKSISIPYGSDHDAVIDIAPGPHTDGSFTWVFDGRVDPTKVRLKVKMLDGRSFVVRSSGTLVDQNGRAYSLPRAPKYVAAAAVRARLGDGSLSKQIPGTAMLSGSVRDPAGGPAWSARTWLATSDRPASPADHEQLVCGAFGPVVDGEVRQAVGARASSAVPRGRGISCTPLHPVATTGRFAPPDFAFFPTAYVDAPTSPTPHVARIALSGIFAGLKSATLESDGHGPTVPMTVGSRGSVLALLPASYGVPGAKLRAHLVFDDGSTRTLGWMDVAPQQRRAAPAARAADPGGGAGWAIQSAELRRPWVPGFPGQLIDGRLGAIDPATGTVFWANGSTSGGGTPRDRAHPVWFATQRSLDSPDNQPGVAQIQRRIAPGRTVIYGHVARGTRTVTIRTPRDVRTVRPSETGGLFLAVYDGAFTQGSITVTADGPGIHGSMVEPVNR